MRVRLGFVSNSSSSSFVVSQKEEDTLKLTLEIPKNKIKIYKSIEEYCKDHWIDINDIDEGDEYTKNLLNKMKIEFDKGNVLKEFKGDSEDCDSYLSGFRRLKLTPDMLDDNTIIIENGDY